MSKSKLIITDVDRFIRETADEYAIPREAVIREMESICNEVLTQVTGYNVQTVLDENGDGVMALKIWGCVGEWHRSDIIRELGIDRLSKNAVKMIRSRLKRAVRNYSICAHYTLVQKLRHNVYPGRIVPPVVAGKDLNVDVYYPVFGDSDAITDTITGLYPLRRQPPHERSRCRVGDTKKYYVRKVAIAERAGNTPGVVVEVDRSTKRLPEVLLRQMCNKLPDGRRIIKCWKRIPGRVSSVITSAPIPRRILERVQEEIGEYLEIGFIKLPLAGKKDGVWLGEYRAL